MIKDLRRRSYRPISDYTMACIAEYMDDDLRECVHFECAPCSNEVFIAEYVRHLGTSQRGVFEVILFDDLGLDLDDIIYTAYCERYQGKVVDSSDIEWLLESLEVIGVPSNGLSSNHPGMTEYTVMMASGDFDIYSDCFT